MCTKVSVDTSFESERFIAEKCQQIGFLKTCRLFQSLYPAVQTLIV